MFVSLLLVVSIFLAAKVHLFLEIRIEMAGKFVKYLQIVIPRYLFAPGYNKMEV